MSSCEISDSKRRFFNAARKGRLKEAKLFSYKFSNDVMALSEALRLSCLKGHLNVVKWLIDYTAVDVNYINEWGMWTPLTAACENEYLDVVKYLVETGHADVNLAEKEGDTPLIWACYRVSMSLATYFLCEVTDLDVNITNRLGNTALHYAVWRSKIHHTQLHEACSKGNVTDVLRLI